MRLKRLTLLSYNNSKEVILMCIHRCFFVGHRDAPSSLYEHLKAEIRRLIISENVQEFVIGSYGSFDALASSAAVRLKSEFPDIRILRLVPYYHPSFTIFLPDGFDGSLYPEGLESVPKRFSIIRANQYMIEHCGYLICFVRHSFGNSGKLLEFASKKEQKGKIHIIRL